MTINNVRKKQKSCVKHIYLVTDDGLFDLKAFYTVKKILIIPCEWMMANLSIMSLIKVYELYS